MRLFFFSLTHIMLALIPTLDPSTYKTIFPALAGDNPHRDFQGSVGQLVL